MKLVAAVTFSKHESTQQSRSLLSHLEHAHSTAVVGVEVEVQVEVDAKVE